MLTIQMPDGHKDPHAKRRVRAIGYLISGLIIMVCLFISYNSRWWFIPVIVDWWWVWASLTGLGKN